MRAVYQDLVSQVKSLDGQIIDLESQQAAKAAALADRKKILASRLQEAYQVDRTPIFQQLLSAGTIADVFQDVGSFLDFGSQDRDLALQIEEDQKVLDTIHASLTEALAAKTDLRAQTLAEKQQLDARMVDLRVAQAKIVTIQKATQAQLALQNANWQKMVKTTKNLTAAIAHDKAAQDELASHIRALIAAQQAASSGGGGGGGIGNVGGHIPSQYNGTLTWPMNGNVTQEFGCTGFPSEPSVGGCAHFHQGIDIAAPMYTPIHAAGPGTVVFAGANPYDPVPKAWIVIIAHSSGLQTWYAHIDNGSHGPAVHAGEQVVAGQVIAYEGMTGRTTGPHLHWAVMYNGQFVNPRLFT